jgi:hypothetical protein
MNALVAVLRELKGLFVDDGALALTIVAVVLLAGAIATLVPDAPLAPGAILVLGCLGALLANVASARPRR